jgi:hypothetical protein
MIDQSLTLPLCQQVPKRGRPRERNKLLIVEVLVTTIITIISIIIVIIFIIFIIFLDVVLIRRRSRALAMTTRGSLIRISRTSLIIKLHRITGRHKWRWRGRHNTSPLLHTVKPLLYVMFPLSTSTTLSKHVVHEKLELARLLALTRGGRREGLGTGGARRSSRRGSGSTMRMRRRSAFSLASSNISCPL